jgi:hypothetical protein
MRWLQRSVWFEFFQLAHARQSVGLGEPRLERGDDGGACGDAVREERAQ